MRKLTVLFLCFVLIAAAALCVSAEEPQQAVDITKDTDFSGTGYASFGFLKDKKTHSYQKSTGNVTLVLSNPEGMASLYLMFDLEYGTYTITDNDTGKAITAGTNNFIHEFIDLENAFGYLPTSVTLDFANGIVRLSEIYVFSSGQTPDFVQKWEPPLDGKTDILMMPTHGDDDQLYFAGLLPYYAGELDCAVQVVYLTSHRYDTTIRFHEMLNGLWQTGVENYPIFMSGLDFRIDNLEKSYQVYANNGMPKEKLIGFAVEQMRRFKPQVVIGHDINGEYGHGMHRVYADMIVHACQISGDPEQYPESAQQYGAWDVPKTYLHSLEENPIEINYDIPLDHYDGLTAFQVTQKYGFPCHETQQIYKSFRVWLYGHNNEITKATQIERYNPCKFGLLRSTVGEDVLKNDFLENIITYSEQERLEQERLEQERLEKERLEKERLERVRKELDLIQQERLEQLRLERLEQERLAQEQEAARLEQERLEREELEQLIAQARKRNRITVICLIVVFLGGSSLASNLTKKHLEKRKGLESGKKSKK